MAQIVKLCDVRIDVLPAKREGEAELESQKSTPSARPSSPLVHLGVVKKAVAISLSAII